MIGLTSFPDNVLVTGDVVSPSGRAGPIGVLSAGGMVLPLDAWDLASPFW